MGDVSRICPHCEIAQSLSNFGVDNKRKNGRACYCRTCRNEMVKGYRRGHLYRVKKYNTSYYERNKEAIKEKSREYRASGKAKDTRDEYKCKNKVRAIRLFGGLCEECGGKFHPAIYDFHHIDAESKEHKISVLMMKKWGVKLETELKKCKMLCANCHRLLHWGGYNWEI